jgi:paired amphipathic helix protein Sin3a
VTDANGIVDGSGVAAVDLRKKLLETAHDTRKLESRAASPSLDRGTPSDDSSSPAPDDMWIRETATNQPAEIAANGTSNSKKIPFFANTTYYTLLRLLQLLYSRLLMCKEYGAKMTATKYADLAPNPIAVELGLDDPNGPTAVLAQVIANGPKDETNVLYMYLLDAWEKVFDNELDQSTLEEHMRWFFGKHAYQVFTLDKIVTAIIKQVQGVLADQKSLDMRTLLENVRNMDNASNRDIIRYRREAELNVGSDEHLYKVDWNRSSKTMRIQLLGTNDPSVEERTSGEDRWREYVDSYILRHPTEWMPEQSNRNTLFLRRCMTGDEAQPPSIHDNIAIRVSLGTYKLFYEAGTEDVLWRKEDPRLSERGKARHEERKKSVWLL